jgi:hypothetical protein
MRNLLLTGLLFLAISCTQKTSEQTNSPESTDTLVKDTKSAIDESINLTAARQRISATQQKLPPTTGALAELQTFTRQLNPYDLYTIATTADYLRDFLPKASEADQDSAYWHFVQMYYRVVNNRTDSLSHKYPTIMKVLEKYETNSSTRAFEEYLSLFGVGLYMSEGMYYLDVLPDYFYSIFDGHVSKGLNAYLEQRSKELAEGFSNDAGLRISFNQVYERVVAWENIIQEYPHFVMSVDADYYYKTYLETLLTGMDNSRVFDIETGKLDPEVQKLYESIIHSDGDSKAKTIVSEYYGVLSKNDFKYSEQQEACLKKYDLSTMLGVQPHTR